MAIHQSKCAHPPCVCVPPEGEKYCRKVCKDAGSEETEIACDCGHPACTNEVLTGLDRLARQTHWSTQIPVLVTSVRNTAGQPQRYETLHDQADAWRDPVHVSALQAVRHYLGIHEPEQEPFTQAARAMNEHAAAAHGRPLPTSSPYTLVWHAR
jgi:hypothetical protein